MGRYRRPVAGEARAASGDGGESRRPGRGVPAVESAWDASGEGVGLSRPERDFLAASVAAHEGALRSAARAARRLRVLTGALAVLLCLAVVAGVAAWRQSGVSSRQRDEAEARRVAALADTLRATEPRTAMRLTLAAWRTADLPETRTALRTAAAQSEQDAFVQPEEGGRALNAPAWLSTDGRILTTVVHGRAVQWDVPRHRRLRSVPLEGLSEGVVDVSADGRLVAYRTPGRRDGLVIADLTDGSTHRLPTGPWTDTDVAFGPSGKTLVLRRLDHRASDGRATLEVWDVHRERLLMRHDRGDDDGALPVLSADDRHLAWCARDGERLRILDVAERRAVPGEVPSATQRAVCQGELTFTSDQRAVASGTPEGIVTWDFRSGRERPPLPIAGGAHSVEFAGDYALAWGPESLTVWRVDLPEPVDGGPREPLLTLSPASSAIGDIRLDLAGDALRYREDGRTSVVRTYSLHGLAGRTWTDGAAAAEETRGGKLAVRGRIALTEEGTLVDASTGRKIKGVRGVQGAKGVTGEDFLRAAAFSPDGRYLVADDAVGRLTLWDARTWRRIAVLRAAASTVHRGALRFSADGSLLAAGAPDGSVQVWETATPALKAATLPAGDGPAVGLAFASRELRITSAHLPARSLPLAPERAAAEVCARAAGGASEAEWRRYLPSVPYRETCGGA